MEIVLIDTQNTSKYEKLSNLIDQGKMLVSNGNKDFENIKINPDEMKVLLFTSGTTGSSKAVMLSHKNICSNIISVAEHFNELAELVHSSFSIS